MRARIRRIAGRSLLMIAFVLLWFAPALVGVTAVERAWAQENPTPAAEPPEKAATAAQQTQLKLSAQEIEALKRIKEGKLPEGLELRRLFDFDLRDEKEIHRQKQTLRRTLFSLKTQTKKLAQQPETPELLVEREIVARQTQSQSLRLAFLELPKAKRLAVVEAEEKRLTEKFTREIAELRGKVAQLQRVAEGNLPEGVEVHVLFEVNLLDPEAVAKRVEFLRNQVKTQTETVAALMKAKQEEMAAAKNVPEKPEAEAKEKTPPTLAELERDAIILRHQCNVLRLAFLTQPPEKIAALLEAEEKKKRIDEAEAAAAQAQLEAELKEREAEQAQQAALEQARQAASAAEKSIAIERARVEEARALLAALHRRFAADQQRFADQARTSLELLEGYQQRMTGAVAAHPETDALYREVRRSLRKYRLELKQALRTLRLSSQVAEYEPELNLEEPTLQSAPTERANLLKAIAEIRLDEMGLHKQETDLRGAHLEEFFGDVKRLNELRLQLMPLLSPQQRQTSFGLTQGGVGELLFEIDHLRLMTQVHTYHRLRLLADWRAALLNLLTLSKAGTGLLKLLLVLIVFIYWRQRSLPLLQRIQAGVLRGGADRFLRIAAHRWLGMIIALADDLGLLLFTYLFFWVIGGRAVPEVMFVRLLALAYVWYRFSLSMSHWLVTSAVTSQRIRVSPELSERIMRSFRLVARYVFPVIVFLALSHRMLGLGYLHRLVVSFFWLGAIPLAVVLLRWWREPITAAHLRYFPESRLSTLLRERKSKWLLLVTIPAAFVMVAGRGLRHYAGDLLSQFRHTRKALAFIFRRQLEKKAETVGHREVALHELPAALREAFTEEPVAGALAIDYFPLQDQLLARVAQWREGKGGCSAALVGAGGVGKTSWLRRLRERVADLPVTLAEIDEDIHSEKFACRHLCQLLGLEPVDTPDQVRAALLAGPPRLIVLDECENFVLRAVSGLAGFNAFGEIVGRTVPHIAWVCSFSKYVWEFVDSARLARNIFSDVYELRAWDEKAIDRLLTDRMGRSAVHVSYDDLIIDRVDGTQFASEVIRTGERYRQLLWDYADGLPRMALHFWLRSLAPAGDDGVKVRLFADPDTGVLEKLNEPSRFLLAAVVTHGNLTVPDAARVLNYPPGTCELLFTSLAARGILRDDGGRYRVSSFWDRAVNRYLKRKHLLYS
ncbi:MAG TPA: hypothetical protein PKW95_20295 [bacterium]|nr:hypothetical protein [bacterium]